MTRGDYPDGTRSQWTYDRLGSRTSATFYPAEGDPVVRSYTYIPNGHGGNSQLLQSDGVNTYAWDANGNMQSKDTPAGISYYTWNSRNHLTSINAPSLDVFYRYDFLGRRTSKTVNLVDSVYQYTGWDLVKETTGGQVGEYLFGGDIDEILQVRVGGSDYFYHGDALGSIRQITDATGVLQNRYSYDTWGEIRYQQVTLPNVFLFTGREAGEDGLLYYRSRYYQPSAGTFISEDPLRFAAGDPNFYRYVSGDPINSVDPSGMLTIDYVVGDVWIPLGELAGQAALESYGDIIADPNASLLAKGGAYLGGTFAALWTPCTSDTTFMALTAWYGASKAVMSKGGRASLRKLADLFDDETGGIGDKVKRKSSRQVRRDWEAQQNKKWPKDPDAGRNQDVSHKDPLADGGTNDLTNIEPLRHDEHVRRHSEAGDYRRWGAQGSGQGGGSE